MARRGPLLSFFLLDELGPVFPRKLREEGQAMFLQGRVELEGTRVDSWTATVRGKRRHHDVEVREDADDPGSCDCETHDVEGACEHQWAVAMEASLLEAAALAWGPDRDLFRFRNDRVCGWRRPGDRKRLLPSYLETLAEMEEWWEGDAFSDEDEWEEEEHGTGTVLGARPHLELIEPASAGQPQPEWVQRLATLPPSKAIRPLPWPEGAADPVEVAWLLDRNASRKGKLTVSVMIRKRSRTGRMGQWKWLDQGDQDAALLPEMDFSAFAFLCNLQGTRGWGWRLPWGTFEVPMQLADGFLPRIVDTGRAYLWERALHTALSAELPPPLRRAQSTCEVVVRHRRDLSGSHAVLTVGLRREGKELDPASIEAGLPGFAVVAGGLLALSNPDASQACAATDWGRAPLSAPLAEETSMIDAFCRVMHGCRWESEHLPERQVAPRPVLRIRAPNPPRARMQPAELLFEMDGVVVHSSDARTFVPVEGALLRRDADAERVLLQHLLDAGCAPPPDPTPETGVLVPRTRLLDVVLPLLNHGWRVEVEGLRIRRAGTPQITVSSGVDWFDVQARADFEGYEVPLPRLLRKAVEGERFVRLDDGSLGVLPEAWLRRWQALLTLGADSGDGLRIRSSQAWTIDLLLAESAPDTVELDRVFGERRAKLRGFTEVPTVNPPRGFRGTLRDYQKQGLGWLRFLQEFGLGGCLADDMGLGKTVQVLALLLSRKRAAKGQPSLVVAPRSLIFHWQEEAARFTPTLRVLDFTGVARWKDREQGPDAFAGTDLVLTTYGTLRRDVPRLRGITFDYAILDESQAIKNAHSQVSKAARVLRADHRLALSGTPVENHLDELWSLFEFLNPGMLGRAKAFRDLVGGKGSPSGDSLRDALRPFLLRRTKERVLTELPEKSEQVLRCDLEGAQRKDYAELRERYRAELLGKLDNEGLDKVRFEALTALLRLRQAACHPGLIDPERTSESCAKLDAMLPMLREVVEAGHKALVFSQFTSFLAIVRTRLKESKIPHAYLDGRTRDRKKQVARFQEGTGCPVFLISLKAGGFGLNLTAADYVFLLDPWWNPAVESQAVDRAHRMGQTKKVMAYRLIARDTIEEKVLELQVDKRALAESLFTKDGGGGLRDLTREDLERLLG